MATIKERTAEYMSAMNVFTQVLKTKITVHMISSMKQKLEMANNISNNNVIN